MNSNEFENIKGNILIVDDLLENLRLLSELLTQQGYKVRSATNGKMALKTVAAKLPDLILLDIKMPDMDGYEVCKALKVKPSTATIPVIFLSASNEIFDKVQAFQCGGIDYITKPFQLEEVIARVENQFIIQRQKILLEKEIAERKQIQEILYQSRALLKGVLDSSLDCVAAFQSLRNPQGKIIDFQWIVANSVTNETLGVFQEELIGKNLLESFPGFKQDEIFDDYVSVVETGEVLNQEYYYNQDSLKGWFQVAAVKLGDGFVLTFRNIDERKQMELALQAANKELQRLVDLDGLTGIANRRCFNQYLKQEWEKACTQPQPISLILCDVDYFKPYNDHLGHLAGDECLVNIAAAMSKEIQNPTHLLARYGGEEFAIVLPNATQAQASQLAQQLHQAVKSLKIPHPTSLVSSIVSVSLGVSTIVPIPETTPDVLIASADEALFRAKKQGRDLIVVSK